MAIKLGSKAPNFKALTTEGEVDFYDYLGDSWGILFSHPADYTPVCTTELGRVAQLKDEFDKRNVKILALSVDPLDEHKDWIKDINETQNTTMNYPIIADNGEVAEKYGMLHPEAADKVPVRSVFIIGPDRKIKLTLTYPPSTGRNFDEILRVIDSLQLTEDHSVATPADWKHGEEVVISPSISDDEADEKFTGYRKVKDYLRYTPDPSSNS
jgi:alkyl hydroperoxide reductase subunit AhpC